MQEVCIKKKIQAEKTEYNTNFFTKNSSSSKYLKIINLHGVVKEYDSKLEMMDVEVVRY